MAEDAGESTEVQKFPDNPLETFRQEAIQENFENLEAQLQPQNGSSEAEDPPEKEPEGKRYGHDVALDKLAEVDPKLAETYRGMQGDLTRANMKLSEIDNSLDTRIAEALEEQMEAQQPPPEPGQGQLTAEQIELFRQVADELGYVKSTDLDSRDQARTTNEWLIEAQNRLLERHGDAFGRMEGNELKFAPGVQAKMEEAHRPITQHGRLNLEDLYTLAYHADLVEQARQEGIEEGRKLGGVNRQELRSAQVETGSIGVGATPQIRGEKGTRSDSKEAVMGRAALVARQVRNKIGLA